MERVFRRYPVIRIGLFLNFPPEGGGAFQYAQSVLHAMSGLDPVRFELIVAYAHPAWDVIVRSYDGNVQPLPVSHGSFDTAIWNALRFGAPLAAWRKLAPYVHPLTRTLLAQHCNLWIFPAQDVLTYALPAPTIGVIHDLMHRHEARFPEVSQAGLFRRRERHYRRMCAYATAILVDSELGRQQTLEAYAAPAEKIHTLPYCIPAYMHAGRTFEPAPAPAGRYFFYPAQFWFHKNHLRLVRAFHKVLQKVPDVHLVLAGSPKNAYAELICEVDALGLSGNVHLLGYVPDEAMRSLYKNALALVMPTFFGPTNIPPLEAMSAGCPMAVSNIYAMPDQVGGAALLFDPNSVDAIADAMLTLATDGKLRSRLSEAGKERSRDFEQDAFDRRFATILDSVQYGNEAALRREA